VRHTTTHDIWILEHGRLGRAALGEESTWPGAWEENHEMMRCENEAGGVAAVEQPNPELLSLIVCLRLVLSV